jgi:hypothetical protein
MNWNENIIRLADNSEKLSLAFFRRRKFATLPEVHMRQTIAGREPKKSIKNGLVD